MKTKKYLELIPIACMLLTLFFVNRGEGADPKTAKLAIIPEIKANKSSFFYIDFERFPRERKTLPVGVFDSGTGGLTVLDSILELDQFNNKTHEKGADGIPDFISEYFIYLGDKANMPYGRYDSEGKSDFLRELIIKDVQFLLGRKYYDSPTHTRPGTDKKPAKAIVIACNTATAFGFDTIMEALGEWGLDIAVFGIIDAGSKHAAASLTGKKGAPVIGVFATEGTCASGGYPGAIKKCVPGSFAVIQQPGFGLAGAIDGDAAYIDPGAEKVRGKGNYYGPGLNHPGYPIDLNLWQEYNFNTGNELLVRKDSRGNMVEIELNSIANYIKYHVTHLVKTMLNRYPDRRLESVILGCTHYPFFEKEIREHFTYLKNLDGKYDKIISEHLTLIDPALSLAVELYRYLARNHLMGSSANQNSRFYISVPNPLLAGNQINESGDFPYAYKYGRAINTGRQFVKRVPFSPKWIKADVLRRIKDKMPGIYQMIFNPKKENHQ